MAHIRHPLLPYGRRLPPGTICLPLGATWLPYGMLGTHTVHTAPIRCTRLQHADTTTIWAPYCVCCSHIAPSAYYMVPSVSHMATHGSHKPSTSCKAQLAPIWPPYGAIGSHMVPSTSCTAYRVTQLPHGAHGSRMLTPLPYGPHTVHAAPT
jgi:hypothetical protein